MPTVNAEDPKDGEMTFNDWIFRNAFVSRSPDQVASSALELFCRESANGPMTLFPPVFVWIGLPLGLVSKDQDSTFTFMQWINLLLTGREPPTYRCPTNAIPFPGTERRKLLYQFCQYIHKNDDDNDDNEVAFKPASSFVNQLWCTLMYGLNRRTCKANHLAGKQREKSTRTAQTNKQATEKKNEKNCK